MAIFGIGATYERDVSGEFVTKACACVGWQKEDAPPAHAILRSIRTGDIIFIKSFNPSAGLTIKAVGLVDEGRVREYEGLGWGVPVRWIWTGQNRLGRPDDKWPVRGVTIYEEFHPEIQNKIIDLLLAGCEGRNRRTT